MAIVGDGMQPEGTAPEGTGRAGTGKAFRDRWNKIGAVYDVCANVGVDRDIYRTRLAGARWSSVKPAMRPSGIFRHNDGQRVCRAGRPAPATFGHIRFGNQHP